MSRRLHDPPADYLEVRGVLIVRAAAFILGGDTAEVAQGASKFPNSSHQGEEK